MDEDYAREVILGDGGVEVFLREMQEFHDTVTRLWDEYDTLMEKYPDRWVVMGKDGVLAVCDSRKEVLSAIEPMPAPVATPSSLSFWIRTRSRWSCDPWEIRQQGTAGR